MIYADPGSVTNAPAAWFSAALTGIFSALVNSAVAAAPSNSTRKYFATAEMDFDPKLYGLAQCAPDLTPAQCQGCLRILQNVVVSARFLSGRPPLQQRFRGVVLPEIQRLPHLRRPGDAADRHHRPRSRPLLQVRST